MMRKLNKNILTIFCILLLGVAGCATMPPSAAKFPYETFSMNNIPYFALVQMCDKEGVGWDYDPLSKIIILKKDNKEFRLLIGSNVMMTAGLTQELSGPVQLKESVIYAPIDLRDYIIPLPCRLPQKEASAGSVFLRSINTVVLDAGHGGKDPGATGHYGLEEKDVVLDVAQKVKEELEHCGLNVYLTRADDEFIELGERPKVATDKKADLFVSIHANANRSRWIEGFEVYYLTETVDDDARALAAAENVPPEVNQESFMSASLRLKAMLWDLIYTENRKESIELAKQITLAVSKEMNFHTFGIKGAPFAVLRGARVPAVLVEIGYISNREGEKKLRDPEYRQKMAHAIAAGIMNFKNYSESKGEKRG